MNITDLKNKLKDIPLDEFQSSAHAAGQHRVFGFTTTNIRSVKTMTGYVLELVPEYVKRKNNYKEWEQWFKDPANQEAHKQKFKRLELAKILFRNVKDSPKINDIGEKLCRIGNEYDRDYLTVVLNLYLLTGRYFDVDNQPLVEINKILSSYSGNFVEDAMNVLRDGCINRLLLAIVFYNPSVQEAMDISYALLQNQLSPDAIDFLVGLLETQNSLPYKRQKTAGGIKNFQYELAICLNYLLFKRACEQYIESPTYDAVIYTYVDSLFNTGLAEYFNMQDKNILLAILLDAPNRIMLKDVFEFSLGIKFNNDFVRRKERKNVKQVSFEKYGYKCFFDCMSQDEKDHKAHELNYFSTKKELTYLEGHHMIQMENSKFFEKDIDISENVIPVCPNCHRKLHNAKKEIVIKMLEMYYNNSDKRELIRKGIFVDIETLQRFYGIEGD